jgi:hypothetical protein
MKYISIISVSMLMGCSEVPESSADSRSNVVPSTNHAPIQYLHEIPYKTTALDPDRWKGSHSHPDEVVDHRGEDDGHEVVFAALSIESFVEIVDSDPWRPVRLLLLWHLFGVVCDACAPPFRLSLPPQDDSFYPLHRL